MMSCCLASAFFLFALFFLTVSEWHFFYTLSGGVFLLGLLILSMFLRRWAVAEYIGIFLTGALIFLPDMIFGTDAVLYEQFGLWFVLSVFWAVPSGRIFVRLFPYILMNAALCSYSGLYILPFFGMKPDSFCIQAALLNLLFPGIRYFSVKWCDTFKSPVFVITPLIFAAVFLTAGTAAQTFAGKGWSAFVCGAFYILVLGAAIYRKKLADKLFLLLYPFFFCWISLIVYRLIEMAELSGQNTFTLLLCVESLLITGLAVFKNETSLLPEEKKDVD